MEYVSVDRFEGGFAVCEREDRTFLNIEREKLPKDVREGSVLRIENSGKISLDLEEEKRRRDEIIKLQNKLFGDSGKE